MHCYSGEMVLLASGIMDSSGKFVVVCANAVFAVNEHVKLQQKRRMPAAPA